MVRPQGQINAALILSFFAGVDSGNLQLYVRHSGVVLLLLGLSRPKECH